MSVIRVVKEGLDTAKVERTAAKSLWPLVHLSLLSRRACRLLGASLLAMADLRACPPLTHDGRPDTTCWSAPLYAFFGCGALRPPFRCAARLRADAIAAPRGGRTHPSIFEETNPSADFKARHPSRLTAVSG